RKDPKADRRVVERTLWQFGNGGGWHFRDGRFTHDLDPEAKEVAVTLRLYYAGMAAEAGAPKKGDYVLQAAPQYGGGDTSVTGTAWVNGTPLNTATTAERQWVVTRLLRKGDNEVRLVSAP